MRTINSIMTFERRDGNVQVNSLKRIQKGLKQNKIMQKKT